MKKFNIQGLTLIVNHTDKIICVSIENKNEKYILYSSITAVEEYDTNLFGKMEFADDINIVPKKKCKDLSLQLVYAKGKYNLLWKNNPVYYLKNTKTILFDTPFSLLLDNGNLFTKKNIVSIVEEINIVHNILGKTKDSLQEYIVSYEVEEKVKGVETKPESFIENIDSSIESATFIPIVSEKITESSEIEYIIPKPKYSTPSSVIDVSKTILPSLENVVISDSENVVEPLENIIDIKEDVNTSQEKIVENYSSKGSQQIENNGYNNMEIEMEYYSHSENPVVEEIVENIISQKTSIELLEKIDRPSETSNEKTLETIANDYNNLHDKLQFIKDIIQTEKDELSNLSFQNSFNKNIIQNDSNKPSFTSIVNDFNNKHDVKTLMFNHQNMNYKIQFINLDEAENVDYVNLHNNNHFSVIDKLNYSLQLGKENSNYLIIIMNIKYLIKKIKNTILLTQCSNKKTILVKNKEYFKLANNDYFLFNSGQLLIPMVHKKLYNNQYGIVHSIYVPRS
jgi:hypothetical protein